MLGIGLAHKSSVERTLKIPFATPAKHMDEYLQVLLPALTDRKVSVTGDIWSAEVEGLGGRGRRGAHRDAGRHGTADAAAGRRAHGRVDPLAQRPEGDRRADQARPRAAAADAGRPAPRIVASVPVCVTDKPDDVKGLVAALLAGYNDLPSYRGVMDTEGAGGPADVSLIGSEDEVRAGLPPSPTPAPPTSRPSSSSSTPTTPPPRGAPRLGCRPPP